MSLRDKNCAPPNFGFLRATSFGNCRLNMPRPVSRIRLFGRRTKALAAALTLLAVVDEGLAQTSDSLNPNPSGLVQTIALQPDGKILVGGLFTTLLGSPSPSYLVRLHPNGTLDTNFSHSISGPVYSILVQPDGKIVVGGEFYSPRQFVCRLNTNGSTDTGFNPGLLDIPRPLAMARQADGKTVVGGMRRVTFPGGPSYEDGFLLRLETSGARDTNFPNATVGSPITSIVLQPDGKFIVGGGFTAILGQSRWCVARVLTNGVVDSTFNPGVGSNPGDVNAVTLQRDGKIIIAGSFTLVGGQARTNIARLNEDGSLDAGFSSTIKGSGVNSMILTLALQTDGKVWVGGAFTNAGGAPRTNLCRLLADGTPEIGFTPSANSKVFSLALQQDGKILVGGSFSSLCGAPRNWIGRLSNNGGVTDLLNYQGFDVTWLRDGSSPELWRATFEISTNGSTWNNLGQGVRVADGWQLVGTNLIPGSTVRARGHAASTGSASWLLENQLPIVPQIIVNDGGFGIAANGRFGFNVNTLPGLDVVTESSSNLVQWLPIQTNSPDPSGFFYFQDPQSASPQSQFYRARFE